MGARDRFDTLQAFVEVARTGSIAGAARALRRDPSSVSRELAALEERLGAQLVQRSTRRLQLTAAGERYLAHARDVLEALEAAERELAGETRAPRGTVRVSAPTLFGEHVLVEAVGDFLRAHPEVRVDMVLDDAFVDLVEGSVDVALRMAPRLRPSALVARRLGVQPHALYASPAYLRERGTPRRPAELARHDVYTTQGGPPTRPLQLRDGARAHVVRPHSRLTSNSLPALYRAALGGLGIMDLPDYLAAPHLASGALVRVLAPWRPLPRDISALYVRRAAIPARVRVFLDFIAAHIAARFPAHAG